MEERHPQRQQRSILPKRPKEAGQPGEDQPERSGRTKPRSRGERRRRRPHPWNRRSHQGRRRCGSSRSRNRQSIHPRRAAARAKSSTAAVEPKGRAQMIQGSRKTNHDGGRGAAPSAAADSLSPGAELRVEAAPLGTDATTSGRSRRQQSAGGPKYQRTTMSATHPGWGSETGSK